MAGPDSHNTTLPPQIGRFRLLRRLGEGAQATVWLAHDPRLDREVALKLLRPGADRHSVDEWLHEARAVSRLTHANIVPVFEADVQDGQAYLVFEYVAGVTLADDSLLTAGHNSQLLINDFQFNTTTHEGGMLATLSKGSLHVVTGLIAKKTPEKVNFKTPSVVLGVRGTEFVVDVPEGRE